MKITNKFNLPETFLSFARDGKYDKGQSDISITTLIDAPRVNILKQQRTDDIEADVSDMIWPLFGTAVHHMLESATPAGNVTMEERLFVNINEWVVSGQIDHQEEHGGMIYISDYKVTSVWSVIYGKEDWVRQLNCYAHMVRLAKGKDVGGVRIIAILRDWQRREAQFKPDYPQSPVAVVEIPLWDAAKAQAYMEERVHLHQDAQMIWDTREAVVECSDEERWTKADSWAVMKPGGKRATKVCETEDEAKDWIKSQTTRTAYQVVKRPGGRTRCEQYCSVSEFCTQWIMERMANEAPDFFGDSDA
jgi:hypothetical protein